MKKQINWLLAFAVVLSVCVASVGWYLIGNRGGYKPHAIRPKDFPQILSAPPNAALLDHSSPSNTRRACGTYCLSFAVDEPYPSDETYEFIEKHLDVKGWKRLEYDLFNPRCQLPAPVDIPRHLNPDTVDSIFPKRKQKGEYPVSWRKEDWVSKNDAHISVSLYYRAELATKEVYRDRVHANLSFYSPNHVREYILRYKDLHPQEFEDTSNLSRSGAKVEAEQQQSASE